MEHPIVWELFEDYALKLINKGVERYGAKGIFEVIRYHLKHDDKPISLQNNFTPDYARKFVEKYPRYKSFFEFRMRKVVNNG